MEVQDYLASIAVSTQEYERARDEDKFLLTSKYKRQKTDEVIKFQNENQLPAYQKCCCFIFCSEPTKTKVNK